ncbi:MAG: response regulator [Myxococcales bacterium]|nr:response regulator [Myxococcales bacterium]
MSGHRLLIIDDNRDIRELVMAYLGRAGRTLFTACDGDEGLAVALEVRPDLIITDVMMPHRDGFELVRALRSRHDFSLVPVIFLTALVSQADRLRGLRLGADDYLPKPFDPQELLLRVERALKWRDEAITNAALVAIDEAAPAGLCGSLHQIGLATLLSMLGLERRSGVIALHRGEESACVYLHDGRVVAAQRGRGGEGGASLVFELLTWSDGSFTFDDTRVERRDEIGMSTAHLLLEGAQRVDASRARK